MSFDQPEGFTLRASYPGAAPPEGLRVLAHEYLLQQQSKTDLISDLVTGDLDAEEQTRAPIANLDGVGYELSLLSCALGGSGRVAGVVAIVPGEEPARHPSHALLLTTLATHFVQAGDLILKE